MFIEEVLMLKKIYKIIKKFVFGSFALYAYNLLAVSFNLVMPINFFTIILVSFLGLPALLALILLMVMLF